MSEDFLGLEDPAERLAATGPALISHPPMGPCEIIVAEALHRKEDEPACNRLIFVAVNDETGEEALDEAEDWARIMGWPRPPTVEEVQQYKINAKTARLARWWDRLSAARTADEIEARMPRDTTRPAKPKTGSLA
jgi:hypothetical protein